jgi:leader peptidase (prepilin peptidase)/N-methyltransferase
MPVSFLAAWAGAGAVLGAALSVFYRRLLRSNPAGLRTATLAAPVLTALAFGALAWRFGPDSDLMPYSVLAILGVALGLIDLMERRLPSVLVYSGVAVIGTLLATMALVESRGPDFMRALIGLAVLTGFYLILALASGGGLGAGDVKLGGLLGLALGWLSWSALITATFLGWCLAALAWLILRMARRSRRASLLPMGPALLFGAFLAITVVPT